jgi:exosortase E/protease (VPEID-CTERM system)
LSFRVFMLAAIFGAEAFVATLLLDGSARVPAGAWLTLVVHRQGALAARCGIGFATLFATFAYLRYGPQLTRLAKLATAEKIRIAYIAAHAVGIGAFGLLSMLVYNGSVSATMSNLASAGWLIAAAAAMVTAALAVLSLDWWHELWHATGRLWGYCAAAAIAAGSAYPMLRMLWGPTSRLTFQIVQWMARPFFGEMLIIPEKLQIGTHRFSVIIADECSGLEGIGLMLVFCLIWLVVFRDEIRFPRALLLLPVGIVVLFFLNSVRILALIVIGNVGAREIAARGFHSQAGWLAFNSVAFGLCVAARRLPWISIAPPAADKTRVEHHDSTTALLMPFLVILAAGMISRAMSGAFESWYALRFLAAGATIVSFRRRYTGMGWQPGWIAAGCGVMVLGFWVLVDRLAGTSSAAMPAALAKLTPSVRIAWIALRALSAIITVPIAEELAFRGYLIRRLMSPNFESLSLKSFTWISLAGSSLIFGFLHGGRWLAGTFAGLIYGWVLVRRGRIGDAILAHSITNAMLAILVIAFGQWQFW